MAPSHPLIGRERERASLAGPAARVHAGAGAIVLLRGEAGAGKTALAREVVAAAGLARLDGFARPAGADAGGSPLAGVLEALARLRPAAGDACARARDVLAGGAGADPGAATAAIAAALTAGAAAGPLAVVLDDAHEAGPATLDLVPALARALEPAPVLLLIAYRDDEAGPEHPIRRLRSELRRDQRLEEVELAPLDDAAIGALLTQAMGAEPGAALTGAVAAFTGGVPFFVAEVAGALAGSGPPPRAAQAPAPEPLPVPEAVRDAVLARAAALPPEAQPLLGAAAVLGARFDPALAAAIAGAGEWPEDALPHGLVATGADGDAAFRAPLVREIFYERLPRPERRRLHAAAADRLASAPDAVAVAEHWLAAGEADRARRAFLAAADVRCAAHAHRDGMDLARRALALAPDAADDDRAATADRLAALERLATCAELAGEPAQAAAAWRELAEHRRAEGDHARAAEAGRQLAAALEIEGRWDQAIDARRQAAEAFAAAGAPAEAGAERLAAAAHLRSAASFRAALRMVAAAADDAQAAGRPDLAVRAAALEGNVRARMGDGERGVGQVRAALATALDDNMTAVAAEIYQRLADSLEHRGDYAAARATYDDAFAFCTNNGAEPAAQLCLACLSVVLRQAGDWERSATLAAEVLATPAATAHAHAAAGCTLGVIHALRGDVAKARAVLLDAISVARAIELTAGEILSAWGLAMVDQLGDAPGAAPDACRALLRRWERSEDRHYAIGPLRWATTVLAESGDDAGARACAAALAQIAADAGQPEALSALAHALGETALLDGDGEQAIAHFERAIALLADVGAPLERIESERRGAAALLPAGRRDEAVERLLTAYRLARRLRMRPSIQRLAAELAAIGEPVDRRLSRRQAEQLAHEQLTRRELQVLQQLATGHTNREIAADLVLSVRTVDMHVRNVLRKLGCRSRADAARRASELGLLGAEAKR